MKNFVIIGGSRGIGEHILKGLLKKNIPFITSVDFPPKSQKTSEACTTQ